ncbi:MAG: hypothetical protein N2444_00195 [Methylocystis sp.]|nr:hypothetical protein [Methylocystis sp.]
MAKIVRTSNKATGEITKEEKEALAEHTKLWIKRAFRTEPIEPEKIIPAIEGLCEAAGLKKPRVVIVPSPLVMAFAYGAAAAIWEARRGRQASDATDDVVGSATFRATYGATSAAIDSATDSTTRRATDSATAAVTDAETALATDSTTRRATYGANFGATYGAAYGAAYGATYDATYDATFGVTDDATYRATFGATYDATANAADAETSSATYDATDDATSSNDHGKGAAAACYAIAGSDGLKFAGRWHEAYQGGNMWASQTCYLTAMRDVIGLRLPEYERFKHWEDAAIHGGFRVMHEEFCLVCDFPEIIKIDDRNRPHCEDGPSHRWRDGWSLYHWHGVRVPGEWITQKDTLTVAEVFAERNAEVRRAGCQILGWDKVLSGIDARLIDDDGDPFIGSLYEGQIPGAATCGFLKVECGTGRTFVIPVPAGLKSAIEAQAWIERKRPKEWVKPEVRA